MMANSMDSPMDSHSLISNLCFSLFFVGTKVTVVGVIAVIVLLMAWYVNLVPLIILNVTELLVPDDKDLFGDCTVIKSAGAHSITERLISMEYVCENTCADVMTDNMDYKVTCRFESATTSWERNPKDIQP